MKKMLDASPYGQESEVFINCDLWHFRSLMFTRQPDFMIGNSYGKFIQRDTLAKGKAFEVPLIRLGFPLFDRHHLHRQTTWGYEGAMNIVTTLVNAVLENWTTTPASWAKPITASTSFVNHQAPRRRRGQEGVCPS